MFSFMRLSNSHLGRGSGRVAFDAQPNGLDGSMARGCIDRSVGVVYTTCTGEKFSASVNVISPLLTSRATLVLSPRLEHYKKGNVAFYTPRVGRPLILTLEVSFALWKTFPRWLVS